MKVPRKVAVAFSLLFVLALLYRLAGEENFGHSVPVVRPSQTPGPFSPNVTVSFATRVGNSANNNVMSDPKTAVVGP